MKRGKKKFKTEHRGTQFHIKPSSKEASKGEREGTSTKVGGKSGEYGGLDANKKQF